MAEVDVAWLSREDAARQQAVDLVGWVHASSSLDALHEQVTWHDTLLQQRPLHGITEVAALGSLLRTAMPDLQLTVESTASAEDHHILLYYTAAGTHTGPLHNSLKKFLPDQQQHEQQHTSHGRSGSAAATDSSSDAQGHVAPTGNAVTWTGSMVLRMQPVQPVAADTSTASDVDASAARTATAAGAAKLVDNTALKATHVWHSWDPLFLYQQIGLAPNSVPAAPEAAPALPPPGAAAADAGGEAEECKAVVRQYFDIYNSGDFSRLPDIVHPTYHYWGLIDLGGAVGVPAMQAMMSGWREALSEFTIDHDWMIAAEGSRVIFRWVLQGLHTKAPLRGVPADPLQPKRVYSCGVTALSITRSTEGGKPGQIWRKVSHANGGELLRQLGVFDYGVQVE